MYQYLPRVFRSSQEVSRSRASSSLLWAVRESLPHKQPWLKAVEIRCRCHQDVVDITQGVGVSSIFSLIWIQAVLGSSSGLHFLWNVFLMTLYRLDGPGPLGPIRGSVQLPMWWPVVWYKDKITYKGQQFDYWLPHTSATYRFLALLPGWDTYVGLLRIITHFYAYASHCRINESLLSSQIRVLGVKFGLPEGFDARRYLGLFTQQPVYSLSTQNSGMWPDILNSFHPRIRSCTGRRYEYLLPLWALDPLAS